MANNRQASCVACFCLGVVSFRVSMVVIVEFTLARKLRSDKPSLGAEGAFEARCIVALVVPGPAIVHLFGPDPFGYLASDYGSANPRADPRLRLIIHRQASTDPPSPGFGHPLSRRSGVYDLSL